MGIALLLAAALVLATDAPLAGLVLPPAVLFAPGWGWARRTAVDPLQAILDAVWISIVAAVPGVILKRLSSRLGTFMVSIASRPWERSTSPRTSNSNRESK